MQEKYFNHFNLLTRHSTIQIYEAKGIKCNKKHLRFLSESIEICYYNIMPDCIPAYQVCSIVMDIMKTIE